MSPSECSNLKPIGNGLSGKKKERKKWEFGKQAAEDSVA